MVASKRSWAAQPAIIEQPRMHCPLLTPYYERVHYDNKCTWLWGEKNISIYLVLQYFSVFLIFNVDKLHLHQKTPYITKHHNHLDRRNSTSPFYLHWKTPSMTKHQINKTPFPLFICPVSILPSYQFTNSPIYQFNNLHSANPPLNNHPLMLLEPPWAHNHNQTHSHP